MEAIRTTAQSNRLVPIAPAPSDWPVNAGNSTQATLMPFSCQPCSKRKVKCNKTVPECSSCRRSKLECSYSAPQSRQRNRKLIGDLHEKLARYEHVLRQHGLLGAAQAQPTAGKPSQDPVISLRWEDSTASNEGRLLTGHGRSRYIETYTWQSLDSDDEAQSAYEGEYEEEDEDKLVEMGHLAGAKSVLPSDPLTGALFGSTEPPEHYHPTHDTAMALWEYHTQNVEPLCKILHIPSTGLLIETFSKHPSLASKADECLLFSIYHFAVYSMSEEDCSKVPGEDLPRKELMQRFHFATRQALINASFLKTTDFKVLQALVLFLLSCRFYYDPATYWSLTGVALRIAQRMGLDRDGEALGLPPFEVQMRRRLLYQVVPLDGVSRQAVGVGPVSFTQIASDSKQPLNVDDNQIWPGMDTSPEEPSRGTTEMIFCLTRSHLGRFVNGLSRPGTSPANLQFRDYQEADKVISEAESEIEEKYIRYCDVVNPLHFLTMANARSAITSWRLRARFPKIKSKEATEMEKKEVFLLAGKILDTDAAVYACPGIQRFWWFIRSIFLWGTWDSLIYVLNMLYNEPSLLSAKETEEQWMKIQRIYENHKDLLEVRNARHVAIGLQALKAWDARFARVEGSGSGSSSSEPPFITSLRLQREERRARRKERRRQADRSPKTESMGVLTGTEGFGSSPSPTGHELSMENEPPSGDCNLYQGLDLDMDFDLNATDWTFWEQLTQRG